MRHYIHTLHYGNLPDLQREVDDLHAHKGRLIGVVDEQDGGIIAYVIGEDNAERIVQALNREVIA